MATDMSCGCPRSPVLCIDDPAGGKTYYLFNSTTDAYDNVSDPADTMTHQQLKNAGATACVLPTARNTLVNMHTRGADTTLSSGRMAFVHTFSNDLGQWDVDAMEYTAAFDQTVDISLTLFVIGETGDNRVFVKNSTDTFIHIANTYASGQAGSQSHGTSIKLKAGEKVWVEVGNGALEYYRFVGHTMISLHAVEIL